MAGEVQASILDSLSLTAKIVQNIKFMKTILLNALLTALIIGLSYLNGYTCTSFCINEGGNLVLGKNFDFFTGAGHVVINKRNIRKSTFIYPPEKPLSWTSRYGSITFNQMGREFPYGGMNEKGLVVEEMWLADAGYPEQDDRYAMYELQWIQYHLDNSATVEDVLASDTLIRILKASAPIHFLVCDASGNMATIEFLEGKMVYHTKAGLPIPALTNDTYGLSKGYVASLANVDEHCTNSSSSASYDRFAKAGNMVQKFDNQPVIDYSFDILSAVSQGELTQWSIVYDIKSMAVHYKTQNNLKSRSLKLADFDFSCHSPSLYIDINTDIATSKAGFLPYSYQENKNIIEKTFATIAMIDFMQHLIPKEAERALIAKYPDTTQCAE